MARKGVERTGLWTLRWTETIFSAALVVNLSPCLALSWYNEHHGAALPIGDSQYLPFNTSISSFGPSLDDGTPTKLYTVNLGRVKWDRKDNGQLAEETESTMAARRDAQERRSLYMSFEDIPLFPGWGTHFAYVYVGTPPQRVSVIVDTGSHYTAFPCAGCRNCGDHTDAYWDHKKSSTSTVVGCDSCHGAFRCDKVDHCTFSQKYSEGSSWGAFQVHDRLWVGEVTLEESERVAKGGKSESKYAVDFLFGCIAKQTGLFKTQLADGIMGMSADSNTLVWQLVESGLIKERIFSLCFSANGGTMVLGGSDNRLNKEGKEVQYTPLTRAKGWFSVKVLDITVGGTSIGVSSSLFQSGKGTIVDSGTTDTYLPKGAAEGFGKVWLAKTGKKFANCSGGRYCYTLTKEEVANLPVISVHMDGGVVVNIQPSVYMDAKSEDSDEYAPRIYMTERVGGVLGANVMQDHNVVFDHANGRIGFAEANCNYKDGPPKEEGSSEKHMVNVPGMPQIEGMVVDHETGEPKIDTSPESVEDVDCVISEKLEKQSDCSAYCNPNISSPKSSVGHEVYAHMVTVPAKGNGKPCPPLEVSLPCTKTCLPPFKDNPYTPQGIEKNRGNLAMSREENEYGAQQPSQEDIILPSDFSESKGVCTSPGAGIWGPCNRKCQQEQYSGRECTGERQVRHCRIGTDCPSSKTGMVVALEVKVTVGAEGEEGVGALKAEGNNEDGSMSLWNGASADTLASAVAKRLSNVDGGDVEVVPVACANATSILREGQPPHDISALCVYVHIGSAADTSMVEQVKSDLSEDDLAPQLTKALKQHSVVVSSAGIAQVLSGDEKIVYHPQSAVRGGTGAPAKGSISGFAEMRMVVGLGVMVVMAVLVFFAFQQGKRCSQSGRVIYQPAV